MISGSLALLYFLLSFYGGRQGSGPNRGRSPVEWGDFPFAHPSIRPSAPPLWAIQPGLRPRGGNVRTNIRMDVGQKITPFHRTSSPIGAAALPPLMKTKEKVEQGKGTADHLMPLGYLFGAVVGALRAPDGELTPPRCE